MKRLADTRKNVFDFWSLFRKECPDFPLEARGTNNSVGIDYATDGVPLYDIYNAGFNCSDIIFTTLGGLIPRGTIDIAEMRTIFIFQWLLQG